MLKSPPYSQYLKECQSQSVTPKNDIYIFIGQHAWEKAKHFQVMRQGAMCLPKEHYPEHYAWPVNGCDILVFDTGEGAKSSEDLAICLYQDGARIVRFISTHKAISIFKKDV